MARKNYLVTGMSRDHCAAGITEELLQVPGVSEVDVDIAKGTVTVDGAEPDDALLRAAIVEAGYEVRGSVAA
ncbi:copper chaperone CopZ [Streptomyces griseochromogenes]|uniref:Copper chaperone CopZ n=1 Tax=Streptomyces griseochromogenes TaxID=68214 RepID=A0A1B1AWW8_9ACTN|nr:heavy-metal-associated domain-containing protein [Streptomyces griseochromogenes]ANP51069.1 transporter [Streptomyces griseochromogenes]MBP2056602.1 copper chaperone CopZ [Streptomyces griseochromogenes]